ncbi:LacI family DNA-binding transcriptional regulator [Leuconostoc palmae]|uniref:LacI family DNA-binding transcriptional regulator n=1 Tax=Leuconostoc palmae TaxID=501487 RepID=UPI0024848CD2|nr:LacI family DNA-binding transcriptional regulator [Leuconostoc palmae]
MISNLLVKPNRFFIFGEKSMTKYKLEDVAKLAEVSKTTVSRVINKRGYLSNKTVEKVYKAMADLNYQPNAAAQQLQRQHTKIIGLIFPTASNPFFGELIEHLETILYQKGYKVILGNSMQNPEKEEDYLSQLLSHQVDGLIIGTHNFNISTYKKYSGLPIVSIERTLTDEIPTISVNNYKGGVLATEFLINQGYRHILHIVGDISESMPSSYRHQGYLDAMANHGLKPLQWQISFEKTFDEKRSSIKKMLSKNSQIEAVFAGNDTDAAQLMATLNSEQTDNIAVIGFDGTRLMRAILPGMASIVQPIEQMASMAVQVLETRIKGEKTEPIYMLDVSLYKGNRQV